MPIFSLHSETEVPAEVYHAVGLLIQQWAQLELSLKTVVSDLMRAEAHHGIVALSGMQARSLVATFRTLAIIEFHDGRTRIDRLVGAMDTALAYRNEYAHNPVLPDDKRATGLRLYAFKIRPVKRGVILTVGKPASAHTIRRRALFISKVHKSLVSAADHCLRNMPNKSPSATFD